MIKARLYKHLNENTFEEAQVLLNNGEKPEDVFEKVYPFYEGFARVKLNGKWNFIDTKGSILSDTWFDYAFPFKEGFGEVELNGKWNYYIDKDGLLYDMNKQPIVESFTGLQKRIYEAIQIGIRKGLRRI